jgi:transposase
MKTKSSSTKQAKNKVFKNAKNKVSIERDWEVIRPNAAGLDVGSREHWVAVSPERAEQSVRSFGAFTPDLEALADWLKECGVTSVAMEATGVYWIAPFQMLERRGFEVLLVNARQIKNVTGRKSDVSDCQWIQRLHTYGLLGSSFRPADPYCVVRSYLRYREELVAARSVQIQHMQKALLQMNLQLSHVLSDISGQSGLAIIRAILEGERNPVKLAGLANERVKSPRSTIAKALMGDYRAEHLFVLQTAWALYETYEAKIADCDDQLEQEMERLPERVDPKVQPLGPKAAGKKIDEGLRLGLYRKLGVDVTAVEGVGVSVALTLLSEVGPDLSSFPTEKHFASWLGLCPDNRISGGRVLSCRTRRVVNRLSDALRLAATALEHSRSALGAYYRRMKAKLGAAAAVTATAHKLARILYRLVKHGEAYVRQGLEDYEKKHQDRRLKSLQKAARSLGFELIQSPAPARTTPQAVS